MLYPCSHCRTERIVAPASEMIHAARALSSRLPGLTDALHGMARAVGPDEMISLCPGCFCITTDLSDGHSH